MRDGIAELADGPLTGILDATDIPIVVVASDYTITHVNRAATDALGVTASDLGRRISEVDSLPDGVPCRRDIRTGDRWFLLYVAPYGGTDHSTGGAVLTFTNVTAFRASIGQAVYEREYTKTILNTVIDPLVVLDSDLHIQTANRAFYDCFGLLREQAQGIPLRVLANKAWEDAGVWSSLTSTVADNREFQTVELEAEFPGAGPRTMLLDARRLARDDKALLLLAFRDITKRKHAELALQDSERRFRTLFESMDEGFCVIEMVFDEQNRPVDYRFLEVNPAFEGQTGIMNARGKLMRQIAPNHEQQWFDTFGRIALTGETLRFESAAAALHRYYDVCAFRVGPPELRRVGFVFNDITERRDLYVQLREANDAKMKFLASMSHELRTPLNAILGYTDLLTLGVRGPLADAQLADVTRIIGAARYLLGLINDILNFTRLEAGQITLAVGPVVVSSVLDRAREFVAQGLAEKDLRFQRGPTPDVVVEVDPERVQQILLNLLTNAIKFTPAGGTISLASQADEKMVHIHVSDTGCGIPVDQQERVFEAFVQLGRTADGGRGGVGLGLAISRDLARRMNGDLTVQSQDGAGSDFILSLPRARA